MAFSILLLGCVVQFMSSRLGRLEVRSFLSAIDFVVSCMGALDGSMVIAVSSAPASPAPGPANSSGILIDRLRVSLVPNQMHPPDSWSPSLLTLWVPVIVILISSGGDLWWTLVWLAGVVQGGSGAENILKPSSSVSGDGRTGSKKRGDLSQSS